jgi:hypothetical protein
MSSRKATTQMMKPLPQMARRGTRHTISNVITATEWGTSEAIAGPQEGEKKVSIRLGETTTPPATTVTAPDTDPTIEMTDLTTATIMAATTTATTIVMRMQTQQTLQQPTQLTSKPGLPSRRSRTMTPPFLAPFPTLPSLHKILKSKLNYTIQEPHNTCCPSATVSSTITPLTLAPLLRLMHTHFML